MGAGMNTETADILSRKEAAAFLGICRNTLDRLDIPRTKIGRRVMFKRQVLNKWIDDHTEKAKKDKV
jgi:predicted DNA-binding transcriptional regulator AlpA